MTFEVAADAYDRFMGAWSTGLSAQMADLARVRRGQRVLDVGCGPGSLTAELVARVGADSVAAVDPSASFVSAARARHPGVDVRQATAEALPFPSASFDATLAQLVVHFMKDPVAGLREMARVTRPGGVVSACVWDFSGNRGPLGPFWSEARAIDPTIEDESERAGTRAGHLKELFAAAGLKAVEEATLEVKREYSSFEDWWQPFNQGVGPAGGFVAGLREPQRMVLRERCRAALPTGGFVLTAHAWAARGKS